MKNRRNTWSIALMTVILMLVLVLGAAVPQAASWAVEPRAGEVEIWDGMDGLLCPSAGGRSGA
jgi:hypothetical protein